MPAKFWKKRFTENWLSFIDSLTQQPGFVFLDASFSSGAYGKYSIAAYDPFLIFEGKRNEVRIIRKDGVVFLEEEPLEVLEKLLIQYREEYPELPDKNFSYFTPGAYGFLSYELGYRLQNLTCALKDDLLLPEIQFAFYDKISIYDHQSKVAWELISEEDKNMTSCQALLEEGGGFPPLNPIQKKRSLESFSSSSFTKEEYNRAFGKLMNHIEKGDIYQANLCQRFSFPFQGDPWETYLRLRESHPTPLSAFLNTGRNFILSASPELFLKKTGTYIETCPIKGTKRIPLHKNEERRAMDELLQSEKDRAEHLMIVDLERNDLGRICETASIKVDDFMRVETCGSVFHLVSTVSGKLKSKISLKEILRGVFPGGSITGAPKRKAMSIIAELEPVVRGVYTGALGWIGFSGDFMFNIPIRTAVIQDDFVHFSVGGGIVSDSTSEGEYQEILDKGEVFFELFGSAPAAL